MRHEFQPGRLLLGLTFLALALVYGGERGGLWNSPWWLGLPVLGVGLFLAVLATLTGYLVRSGARHRDEIPDGPPSARTPNRAA